MAATTTPSSDTDTSLAFLLLFIVLIVVGACIWKGNIDFLRPPASSESFFGGADGTYKTCYNPADPPIVDEQTNTDGTPYKAPCLYTYSRPVDFESGVQVRDADHVQWCDVV